MKRRNLDLFVEDYDWKDNLKRLREKLLDILDRKTWNDIWKRVDGYVESSMIEKKFNNIEQIKKWYKRMLERLFW